LTPPKKLLSKVGLRSVGVNNIKGVLNVDILVILSTF
jgi:hypothetical protein